MPSPVFIDFEASSLNANSYPIEVAWSCDDGSVESWLISPATVDDWTDWSDRAERTVHGLSRARLVSEGQSPALVAQRMNQSLANRMVYCDGGPFDRFWLHRLFKAANSRPAFQLADFDDLLQGAITPSVLTHLLHSANRIAPVEHRAAADVKHLKTLWHLIEDYRLPATA